MRIPQATLSEIQNRLDLAEVVGEYVALQKRGNRYWGRCPFHEEKTPSFSVTPDKGVFYCFGCHKGGGLYQFVMELEKVSFIDAVEMLAKKAGVEIQREEGEKGGVKRETFLELNRRLAGSFHWLLTESPRGEAARAYLEGRGVPRETIEAFQLGYAPPDREWLERFLTGKNYSEDFLAKTGLFSESARGRTALFANRIIFPIANLRGEIIAFGGRALGEGVPKYLNSPETSFFRKGENLFGIDKALPAIKKGDAAIVVEGYMDVLAMHQAGITNCVAPLGTALTETQVKVLKRAASRCILVFDGDEAGEKATLRAVEMLERQELAAHVVALPDGQDPADIVQREGRRGIERCLEAAQPCFAFLLEKVMGRHDRSTPEGKERIRDFLLPFIAAAGSRVRADDYMRRLAEAITVDEGAVRADFASWKRGLRQGHASKGEGEEGRGSSTDLFLMLALAIHQELFPRVRSSGIALSDLEDPRARELFVALEEAFRAEEMSFDALLARVEDETLKETLVRSVSSGEFDVNQEKAVEDGVKRIKQRTLKRKSDELAAQMRRMESEKTDPAQMRQMLAEKMHLDDELAKLRAKSSTDPKTSRGEQDTGI